MNKSDRQNFILDSIAAQPVSSQLELCEILRRGGFAVTQASVSRDLDELGVVKIHGKYSRPAERRSAAFAGPTSLRSAGDNLIVARTYSGLASAVAVRIDAARIPEIVGTIAGDDTIFIAVADSRSQKAVMKDLWNLFEIERREN